MVVACPKLKLLGSGQKLSVDGGEADRDGYRLPTATTSGHCCCTIPKKKQS